MAVFLASSVYFKTSSARYKVTQEVQIVTGNIKANLADLNIMNIYVDGEKLEDEQVPNGNYVIDTGNTKCTVNGEGDSNITFEYKAGKIGVYGVSQSKTKCNIYLNKIKKPTDDLIAEAKPELETFENSSCLATVAKANSANTSSDQSTCSESTNGLFTATDDYGTTYYYRGSVNNNWVKFANLWWRIIRINGNGTIRLIYAGTEEHHTQQTTNEATNGYFMSDLYGIDDSDGNSNKTYKFNNYLNQNAYIGYMYGTAGSTSYEAEHKNSLESNIKIQIDKWYTKNLAQYSNYLDGSTGFCGDRSIAELKDFYGKYTNLGYGRENTYYKAVDRLSVNHQPSYECPQKDLDLYTTREEPGNGNGKLINPVGLISIDEVAYAGGKKSTPNYGYWLWTGLFYWTISPSNYYDGYAYIYGVASNGSFGGYYSNNLNGIRPVVNLKPEYFKTQDADGNKLNGTIDNPYIASADNI